VRRYILRRLLQTIPLLFGISLISFALVQLAPGDPTLPYTQDPNTTPEEIDRVRHEFGLDVPLPLRYVYWVLGLVHLDLGRSYRYHSGVLGLIGERLPATFELVGASLLLGALIGIPLGLIAAHRRGKLVDTAIRVMTTVGDALPHWWLGLIAIVVLTGGIRGFRIFPSGGMYTIGESFNLADHLWHLFLPAVVLATGGWVTYARYVRSETIDVLSQDYVRTAHAKGVDPRRVALKHVLRNALIPTITVSGYTLPILFAGAALVELVFSWPGMGRFLLLAAFERDYPVILGGIMIASALVVLGNLMADVLYGAADPRIRYA
jgi:peptide/nickel transport system permease protein